MSDFKAKMHSKNLIPDLDPSAAGVDLAVSRIFLPQPWHACDEGLGGLQLVTSPFTHALRCTTDYSNAQRSQCANRSLRRTRPVSLLIITGKNTHVDLRIFIYFLKTVLILIFIKMTETVILDVYTTAFIVNIKTQKILHQQLFEICNFDNVSRYMLGEFSLAFHLTLFSLSIKTQQSSNYVIHKN